MSRPRRASLLKRLWRAASRSDMPERLRAAARAVFKRLDDAQLEVLLRAVESQGAYCVACVSLPRLQSDDGDGDDMSPPKVLCRLFRWPDIATPCDVKRLDIICRDDKTLTLCCNPYHWSRITIAEIPALPYSKLVPSIERTGWTSDLLTESLETGGTHQMCSTDAGGNLLPQPWCTLAYWELRQRVGRLLANRQECLAVFGWTTAAAAQDGFCLASLAAQHPAQNESVDRTRHKIGLGMFLWRDSDGIWIYNRSSHPLFVNSPTLDPPGPGPLCAPRTMMVYRVNPGYSARVFDMERAHWYQQMASMATARNSKEVQEQELEGPFNPFSVRVSFAKGWGPKYARQCIVTCPCWLEILLDPCR